MSIKKILSLTSLTIFLSVLIIIFINLKGNFSSGKSADNEIIGKGMVYSVYDENNNLSAEITSSSTIRDFDKSREPGQWDRTLLSHIKGTIFKHGKFKSDVKFSSDSGYVENGNNNFLLKGNARIESEEAAFLSDRFFMDSSSLISNDTKTDFILKNLKGTAEKGINYLIKHRVIDLFKSSGKFVRSGKEYDFSCNKLGILQEHNRIVFKGRAFIMSDDSTMKGKEIILSFKNDFKKIIRVDIRGKGYFYTKREKKGEFWELKGKIITGYFDDSGDIKKIEVSKNGMMNLNRGSNRVKAESQKIHINFNHISKQLKTVKLLKYGKIITTGKRSFSVSSKKIKISYNEEGEIDNCNTLGETEFRTGEYNGSCRQLDYYPGKDLMTLTGDRSIIEKGENRFLSTEFTVNTKEEKFFSDKEITSTIHLDSGSSIFSKSPVFVSSKKIEIYEKTGVVRYSENVNLFQGDTRLTADKVEIGDKKEISISGKAKLTFKNGENEIFIGGEELKIDPYKNRLYISGKAILREGENKLGGDSLTVSFNEKNEIDRIIGNTNIDFKRKKISGKSKIVLWKFSEKVIIFSGNAQLAKGDSGRLKGDEIRFHLTDEKVIIKSFEGKRSETRID